MTIDNIWQRATDFTDRIFQVTSGLDLPRGNQWPTVVTVFLTQANERLDSVRVLLELDKNHWDSAVILTRSLFELAVNLAYIGKGTNERLPRYLGHGGIPSTKEEAERLQREIEENGQPALGNVVPGQAWERLKQMCHDLGRDWVKEYETFYRYSSVPTHAGAFTLGKSYMELLKPQLASTQEKATVLITATAFHLRVAEIAAQTFPRQISLKKVKELRDECQALGMSLPRQQTSG